MKNPVMKLVGKVVNQVTSSVSQTSVAPGGDGYEASKESMALCRQAAAEGIVLLKNDGGFFPVKDNETLSVFGRCQNDTFYVGYGSGGDVNPHYRVSFMQGLRNCERIRLNLSLASLYREWCEKNPPDNGFWGHWPMCYDEMPVTDKLAADAAAQSDKAIIILGRAAGEDRENTLTAGSFYLSDEEERMIAAVSSRFEKTAVVLNIGGVMDFSWCEKYAISALMIVWQGGMEAGNGFADVVSGKVSPSGCLPDTIARRYEDYPSAEHFGDKKRNVYREDIYVGYRYFETFTPDRVLFPFGHGLSYSDFRLECGAAKFKDGVVLLPVKLVNTGKVKAKQTAQVYCEAPQGMMGKPVRVLCAFAKSEALSPGKSQKFSFEIPYAVFASYDDAGATGHKSCFVLEPGVYRFYAGFSVRDAQPVCELDVPHTVIVEQLSEAAAPAVPFMRIKPFPCFEGYKAAYEPVPARTVDLKQRILDNLPHAVAPSVGHHYRLEDVKTGKITLDDFVSELTFDELEALSRGDYVMNSPLGPKGNASVFGGVTQSLRDKGVPPLTCTDGPSGIRLACTSSLLPNGTALASTWNEALIAELYGCLGDEMNQRGSHVLLAPGMNIHRNPLCGRNFEYFSEDPLLSGLSAAAVVKGLQSKGVSACPKHFACNNQETNRTRNNSIVSERALREIYLKGFEICVKQARPLNLMTSYNQVNGVWSHYHYELVTAILRGEWGYQGNVMTDWWMRSSASPEFPDLRDQAYRVRAGVDVLMPGGNRAGKRKPDGTLLETVCQPCGITVAELQDTARHVLAFAMEIMDVNDQI
ncbi:MAG: glycoside hydrolase family 3 C-terminal domain-containing protein [Clostridia bacterium]|nr:glycoside hydrolase family 3 C-terminal domain-containing protein [Clostridia bacterium]